MRVLAQFCIIFFAGILSMAAAPKGNPKANRLINQGETHLEHYRLKEAETAIHGALKELEANPGMSAQKVRALILHAALHRENCQFEDGFRACREALLLAQALKPKARAKQQMMAYWELGLLHGQLANYPEAIVEFKKAIETVKNPKDEVNLPLLMTEAPTVYIESGRYTEAKAMLDKVRKLLPLYAPIDRDELEAELNNSLGYYYYTLGRYKEAEENIQRSVDWFTEHYGRHHLRTAVPLSNLALVYQDIGAFERARRIFKQNLQTSRRTVGDKHLFTSIDMANLAGLLLDAGDLEESMGLYEQTLALTSELLGEHHPYTAVDHSNLALAYAADDQYERAEDHLKAAIAIINQTPGALALLGTSAFQNLGGVYSDLGKHRQAIPWLNQALELELKNKGNTSSAVSNILFHLAEAEFDLGNKSKAVQLARRKYELEKAVIRNIFSFTTEEERLAFLGMVHPLEPLISFGAAEDIAPLVLERKAMVIDSLARNHQQASRTATPAVQAVLDQIRKQTYEIIHLETRISIEIEKDDPADLKAARNKLEATQTILDDLHKQLARITDRPSTSPPIVPSVQAALPRHGVLVEYVLYDQYTGYQAAENSRIKSFGALLLPADAPPQWISLGPMTAINKLIKEYSPTQPRPDIAYEDILSQLHEKLISPLQPFLPEGTQSLIIAPAGQLNFINFATLITPKDQFLCEQYDIRHLGTGRDLLRSPRPNAKSTATLAVFANPQFGQQPHTEAPPRAGHVQQLTFPPLPGTTKESDFLQAAAAQWQLTPNIFTGKQATETRLQSQQAPHVLHLATHGFFLSRGSKKSPRGSGTDETIVQQTAELFRALPGDQRLMRSGLALAGAAETLRQWQQGSIPDARTDGILTAAEVRLLQLNNTWLTVLSACNTGAGRVRAGEGVLGLRRAFKQAGTQNLVFTLWPISDAVTAGIMQEFYQDAFQDHDAPRALAEVQKKWLLKLRQEEGTKLAVQLAGPFILTAQGPARR